MSKKTKHTAKLTSKSIESSGLSKDYDALSEYIWNGFDAGATTVEISFDSNEVGYLNELKIKDNGSGIDLTNISETFGNFNVSQKKKSFSDGGYVKGKKGKGRFSFVTFANKAVWSTIFKENDKNLSYKIEIEKNSSQHFQTFDNKLVSSNTGTEVSFQDIFSMTSDKLENINFYKFLSSEFGWFLFLNKDKNYQILINGDPLNYMQIIEDNDKKEINIEDSTFQCTFIRWSEKIGEKYYYYFLNNKKEIVGRKHTSFNNKTENFHHSVYVESDFFESFRETENEVSTFDFAEKNQTDPIFKSLLNLLNSWVYDKEKNFVKLFQAEKLIIEYNRKRIIPSFKENSFEQLRKKDLENVLKELYCVQPKIFQGLNNQQSKTIVGFLNLILDTDQRESVLQIVDSIVNLNDEERQELASVLSKTKLTHITELIKFLKDRYYVVESLKLLIYDLEKFTTERDHIQKIIENNYWLFGEQFHLVSADKNFETVLNNYLSFLDNNQSVPAKVDKKNKLKRPDIFIAKKMTIPSSDSDNLIEDNILVELKRPSVIITKTQFSQVEDYMNFIISNPEFNSQLRSWKFYIVGKEVDEHIKNLYDNQSVRNKKFLVQQIKNFEIYILTWDDLFRIFQNRHSNFIDKLDFKDSVIEELESKGIAYNREASDYIVKQAVNL